MTLNLLRRFTQTLLQSFLEMSSAQDAWGERAQLFVAASQLSGFCPMFLSHLLQLQFLSFTATNIFSTTNSSNQNLQVNLYKLFKVNCRFIKPISTNKSSLSWENVYPKPWSKFFFKGEFYYRQRNSESPNSSSKLIRHPGLFCTVNSTGRGVPPPPSTGSLHLLCQCFFQAHAGSTQQHCNWLWDLHMQIPYSTSDTGCLYKKLLL